MKPPTPSTAVPATSSSPSTSTGSRSWGSAAALASYAALASLYLLYLPHAEFVLDDWFQFLFYRIHQARGWAGEIEVVRILLQNRLYNTFQFDWLSFFVDSLLVWVTGYAPRLLFSIVLLIHITNAWLLYRLLRRLRIDSRLAYLAGACFLLTPFSHGPLFWFLGTPFYTQPPVFLFLYWLSLATTLAAGALTLRAALWQSLLIVLVLFAGGAPSFGLLLFGGAWMALCFFPRDRWRAAAQAIGTAWAVMGAAFVVYVSFISKAPPSHNQIRARYDFSRDFLINNWRKFYHYHLEGMSGFGPHAYYRVHASAGQILAAAFVVLIVALGAWLLRGSPESQPARRVIVFAAGMAVLAYAPLIYLIGGTLRHYYTVSPYFSLLLAALCWMLPGGRSGASRIAAGAALCGYFAMCTVAEIEQCWTPMSEHIQAVKAGLRRLRDLQPGEPVIIPRFPMILGTAPNFALISNWGQYMAEVVTGVPRVEFWREIVIERGHVRLFHRHALRDTTAAELAHAHVLVGPPEGPYVPRRYWAEPVGAPAGEPPADPPGSCQWLLHCLRDYDPCAAPPAPLAASDLAPLAGQVYYPRPFEHGNLAHLHY
ncbi:MAG TPA: hypothetical protein VEU62_02375 [Bryobacterales bacterium]|nr:hypothetical protein [Bryobacterales bacterium]